jgi:uncharacterized protein YdeI (YjbR/CyaY-like superfamily)
MKTPTKNEYPVKYFKSQKHFAEWLEINHTVEKGIWIQFFKKDSGMDTITLGEALEEALCYGWIDSQLKKFDKKSWIHKFTPRRAKSMWSKKNIEHIERLMKMGKMKSAGLKEVESAKKDGRWQRAYDSPGNMELPEDFIKLISKNKKASSFFETLNKANKYAIAWRLQTAAKPETRIKRMKAILEMLENGKKFH